MLALTLHSLLTDATNRKERESQRKATASPDRQSQDPTRIADYYQSRATNYVAQLKEHEQMAAAYKRNPIFNSSKFATGTVNHCDYLAQSLKKDSDEAQDLAKIREETAKEATQK